MPVEGQDTTLSWEQWRDQHPCILDNYQSFLELLKGKRLAVFLDYDGTLTPIVSNPENAHMSEEMRKVVKTVAQTFPTAIISGRSRDKVEAFVQLPELFYAGSHGMDISGPMLPDENGNDSRPFTSTFQPAAHFKPLIDQMFIELDNRLKSIPGASVEHNNFCISAHFRNCPGESFKEVISVVEDLTAPYEQLRVTPGRKVLEIRPRVDWHKGTALSHLVASLGLQDEDDVIAIYIGDDHTDEDAFHTLDKTKKGFGILVTTKVKKTGAKFTLRDPPEVQNFLARLVEWGRTSSNGWIQQPSCNGWKARGNESD
uniref:Trehalose 6-phosphate phosphatase n=1 Tax=Polytomella parva TaxID=51329 RepID=A0A7S0V2J1_9CHLO|mmetsp:Transcript_29005/g.53302  ORF Transcript_29005/g.53302 Transcript_29005/m.53302 type:complete len:314 (+) Transcript_29005:29-970(+)